MATSPFLYKPPPPPPPLSCLSHLSIKKYWPPLSDSVFGQSYSSFNKKGGFQLLSNRVKFTNTEEQSWEQLLKIGSLFWINEFDLPCYNQYFTYYQKNLIVLELKPVYKCQIGENGNWINTLIKRWIQWIWIWTFEFVTNKDFANCSELKCGIAKWEYSWRLFCKFLLILVFVFDRNQEAKTNKTSPVLVFCIVILVNFYFLAIRIFLLKMPQNLEPLRFSLIILLRFWIYRVGYCYMFLYSIVFLYKQWFRKNT